MEKQNSRHVGVVKWFSRLKGYGFIKPDDDHREVFVHFPRVDEDGVSLILTEGERVEFELIDLGKGPQARRVWPQAA